MSRQRHIITLALLAVIGAVSPLLFAADNITETRVVSKNQALAKAFRDGWAVIYLDTAGKLKSYFAKSAEDLSKTKEKVQAAYDKKKAGYDKAEATYVKRNPGMKYGQLPPIQPTFTPIEAHVVRGGMGHIVSVTPKENIYALYKVTANGQTAYESGYEFSTALQQLQHERRFRQQYNNWIRDGQNGEAPAEPKYEKIAGGLAKAKAARAADDFNGWQKKYEAWEKRGREEGKEPETPNIDNYKEETPDTVVRQNNNRDNRDRNRIVGPGARGRRR